MEPRPRRAAAPGRTIAERVADHKDLCPSDAAHGPCQHTEALADTRRAVAVVAAHRLRERTGRFAVQTAGVARRGDVPRTVKRGGQIGRELVDARDDIERLVPVEHGGQAVAAAVDVDDLAGLGNGIRGGQIDLRVCGGCAGLVRELLPVPEERIVCAETVVKAHCVERDAAAEADRFSVQLRGEIVRGLCRRPEIFCVKAIPAEIFQRFFCVHTEAPLTAAIF